MLPWEVTENLRQIFRDMHSTLGQGSFFSRIRIYNGLRSGFSVKERKTRFSPFKLSVSFSEKDCKSSTHSPDSSMNTGVAGTLGKYLFITAIPLISAFTQPYEDWTNKKEADPQGVFVTRHNSNHILSNIEESVIPYLGFLPQDMNGKDIFSFVHPDDQSTLKEIFNQALLELERPCKSKYIRIRVRNTGYVYLNSWWSFFINPWSRQLEFVHGKHTVKKGPRHPDVFAEVAENVTESEFYDSRPLQPTQADINNAKKIVSKLSFADASSKTRRDLSSFMITLLEEMAKSETKNLSNLGKIGAAVIGNISPHQSDSSESPPSYNQLTYNENLTRFFNSQPKTLVDKETFDNTSTQQPKKLEESSPPGSKNYKKKMSEDYKKKSSEEDAVRSAQGSGGSGEQTQTVSGSGEDNGKNSSTLQTGLSAGQVPSGRDECMLSMDGSGSGSRYGSGSRGASVDTYTPPELTIDLLARHNKEMEAKMLCKYKESKKTGEIRFIRDQKHDIAQQEAINRLNIQKANAVNLQLELNNRKRLCSSKQAKQVQSIGALDPKGAQGMNSGSMWRQYGGARAIEEGAGGSGQPGSDATKIKHAHQGFVGFNQANMMERGTPANLTGFPNLVVDPAYFMAFNSNNVGQHKVQLMQSNLMMHDRNEAYLRLDQNTNNYHRIEGQTGESRSSASKILISKNCKRQRSGNHEPELQNCLAVSSCLVCQPEAGCSGQAGAKCNKKLVRTRSRAGSRATSIKGEPGSALESSASASVKEKKLSQVRGLSGTTTNPRRTNTRRTNPRRTNPRIMIWDKP